MLNEGRAHCTHEILCCAQDVADCCMITSSILSITVFTLVHCLIQACLSDGVLFASFCRYGLETVSQLFSDGCLGHSHIHIEDHPDYRHRGFMLDTG